MFQMYNTLEDIIHSSKMNDNNSKSLEKIFVANNNQSANTMDKNSKTNSLKINNNCINNSDQNLFNANTKSSISQSNQSFHSSIDSNDSNFSDFCQQNNNDIKQQRNNNICNNNNNNNNKLNSIENSLQLIGENNSINNESINSLNTFSSNTSLNVFDNSCQPQNNNINNNNNNVINNHLSVNSKSVSVKDNKRLILKEKKRILKELDKTNGYINRNCINSDHIVNPLLDTINTLTSCSDSSDECDINKKCYSRGERHRRIFNGSHHLNRKSCNYYYSSSDGDSVSGYTGTNSLESGYKSDYLGSNTPEVIDGSSLSSFGTALDCTEPSVVTSVTEAVNQAISHQMTGNESSNTLKKKNTSKQASNESSVKISFERNLSTNHKNNNNNKYNEVLIEKQNQSQTPDDMSSNASVDSFQTNSSTTNTNNSRKTVGMFSEKIANRLKAFNNDSQLEHLLKLRKSLLKALKRCEQISSPANSRDGSPITAGISASSRSSSPASTIVKNNSQNSLSNTRRLRDDINCNDKCLQKLVTSPLTIRSHEDLDRSCDQLSTYSMNSLNSTSNTNTNNNTNNSKSVRFNGSVKFSSVSNQKEVHNKAKQQISGNYVSNKSILKDPLCETLRSSIKAGEFKNNCSLEGEIDELLYGRTGPYYYSPSLEPSPHLAIDDCMNPSSSVYVSRIEEKYRTFTTSCGHTSKQSSTTSTAANSKKTSASNSKEYSTLKTGFSSPLTGVSSSLSKSHDSELFPTPELRLCATTRPLKSSTYSIYGASHNQSSSSTYGTKSNRKSTKTHFTEMAKCMLEILDDLQPVPQNLDKNSTYKHFSSTTRLQNSLLSKRDDETDSIDLLMKELSNGQSDTSDMSDISSISYRTFPEQHIYEEILYEESLESLPKDHKHYGQYLPVRRGIGSTVNTFAHSSANRVEAPIHQSHIRHVGSWGRTSNKPKQRSNLYTIFADESERRNISKSLEREFSKRNPIDCNTNTIQTVVDNYGFKA